MVAFFIVCFNISNLYVHGLCETKTCVAFLHFGTRSNPIIIILKT
jgi:intracellular septation protein A